MTIQDYLVKTCLFLNIEENDVKVEEEESDERLRINLNIPEEKQVNFFKENGEAIMGLEYLLKLVFREEIEGKRLIFDVNNFRKQSETLLIDKASDLAKKVIETGKEQIMSGLNSYERYIVHSAIGDSKKFSQLLTYSRDVGQDRCLIISLKTE